MILIIDFGSQTTHLIKRRLANLGIDVKIILPSMAVALVKKHKPTGIILSGGPASVYEQGAPAIDKQIFDVGLPILGICYGWQLTAYHLAGKVVAGGKEYGPALLTINKQSALFTGIEKKQMVVWMSHGDEVIKLPLGFSYLGSTADIRAAAVVDLKRRIFGLQFHPEVTHTKFGSQLIENFLFEVSGCSGDWSPASFIDESIRQIRERVGRRHVLCGLSGGVDSSVVAVLLQKAIGTQLHCVFVDTGLLRFREAEEVEKVFTENFDIKLTVVNSEESFYSKLKNVTDPERKRKIIGAEFIRIFEKEADALGNFDFLAQGTLYPDVIESVSFKGPSVTIKSHHNVGGLPEQFDFELLEPLRELFKDEVREVGRALGLPDILIGRHPFPGPGLAVRILGAVTPERVGILQRADAIFIEELHKANIYNEIWQAFAVLLPVQSVGVMGDQRTYENVLALRAVTSRDGMTADWYEMPYRVLSMVSNRIINEVRGINRVVYDVSSKPPATIEWE